MMISSPGAGGIVVAWGVSLTGMLAKWRMVRDDKTETEELDHSPYPYPFCPLSMSIYCVRTFLLEGRNSAHQLSALMTPYYYVPCLETKKSSSN
jgi:hypothetical protein